MSEGCDGATDHPRLQRGDCRFIPWTSKLGSCAVAVCLAGSIACGGEDSRFVEDEPQTHTCEETVAVDTLADRVLKTTLNDLESYSLSQSLDAQGEALDEGGGKFTVAVESIINLDRESRVFEQDVNTRVDFGGANVETKLKGFSKSDTLYIKIVNQWVKTEMTDQIWHQSDPLMAILPALSGGERSYSDTDDLGYHELDIENEERVRGLFNQANPMLGRSMALVEIEDHRLRLGVNSECYIEQAALDIEAVINFRGVSVQTQFEYEWDFSDINESIHVELPGEARRGRYVQPRMVRPRASESTI